MDLWWTSMELSSGNWKFWWVAWEAEIKWWCAWWQWLRHWQGCSTSQDMMWSFFQLMRYIFEGRKKTNSIVWTGGGRKVRANSQRSVSVWCHMTGVIFMCHVFFLLNILMCIMLYYFPHVWLWTSTALFFPSPINASALTMTSLSLPLLLCVLFYFYFDAFTQFPFPTCIFYHHSFPHVLKFLDFVCMYPATTFVSCVNVFASTPFL